MSSPRIWKYLVKPDHAEIQGIPLHIGLDPQSKQPAIWCFVDADNPGKTKPAPYVIVMTGEEIPDDAGEYVTTVTGIDGRIVAHFFKAKT